jgi:hypothetical protein
MSESTEELATATSGLAAGLGEAASVAGQLSDYASELSEEAAGHGWHGIAGRMQEAGEALQAAAGVLGNGQQACETAAAELGLITDKIPAAEVVGHLGTSSTQLGDAAGEVEGAIAKVEEAQTAVTEVGQEGMMQATQDLYTQVSELHGRITEQQAISEREQAEAETYTRRQRGN